MPKSRSTIVAGSALILFHGIVIFAGFFSLITMPGKIEVSHLFHL